MKGKTENVLKAPDNLIISEIRKTEKYIFRDFRKVSQFFWRFSKILWSEISSNPGITFVWDQNWVR